MQPICEPGQGLTPSPKAIRLDCDCPDWTGVRKHLAAVLYGVGARLDKQPKLLLTLRHIDANDLVQAAGAGLASPQKTSGTANAAGRCASGRGVRTGHGASGGKRDAIAAFEYGGDISREGACSEKTRSKKSCCKEIFRQEDRSAKVDTGGAVVDPEFGTGV